MIKSLVSILSLLCLAICFTSTQAQPALINGYQLNNYTTGSLTLTVLDLSRCYAGTETSVVVDLSYLYGS
jgi:hypothetical protein